MTLHAAGQIDRDGVEAAREEIALIKFYGAGVLHDVIDRAIQAHGALGVSTDLPLEAMYRHARDARIYDVKLIVAPRPSPPAPIASRDRLGALFSEPTRGLEPRTPSLRVALCRAFAADTGDRF